MPERHVSYNCIRHTITKFIFSVEYLNKKTADLAFATLFMLYDLIVLD